MTRPHHSVGETEILRGRDELSMVVSGRAGGSTQKSYKVVSERCFFPSGRHYHTIHVASRFYESLERCLALNNCYLPGEGWSISEPREGTAPALRGEKSG